LSARGTRLKTQTITIIYATGLIPYFSGKFSRRFENTRKSSPQPSDLLAFLLVSRENKRSRRLSLFRTRELSRWPARTMARAANHVSFRRRCRTAKARVEDYQRPHPSRVKFRPAVWQAVRRACPAPLRSEARTTGKHLHHQFAALAEQVGPFRGQPIGR
jgi:hypothetical protein